MGDASAAVLSLSNEEDSVMGRDIMMVVSELEIENNSVMVTTSETGIVVYKNVSCQVDFSSQDVISLPIVFCGLHSSSCEATTQCDIPINLEKNLYIPTKRIVTDKKLGCNSASFTPIKKEEDVLQNDLINETIEEVILKTESDGQSIYSTPRGVQETQDMSDAIQTATPTLPKRRRKARAHMDSDFEWENDDFWEDTYSTPKKKSSTRAKSTKQTGKKVLGSNTRTISSNLGKCKTTPKRVNLTTGENSTIPDDPLPSGNDPPYIKLVTQKDWCSDWITDDEEDDEEDGIPKEDFSKKTKEKVNSTCNDCMLKFSTPLLLLEHTEANHTAHICDICGFTTTFKHKLERHMVKHSNVKAFICDICGKQYSQNQNLRDHISRAHSDQDHGDRYPFSCPHCKRLYRDERNFMKHQEQSGGPCDICGITMECSGQLWSHRRDHYSHCDICKKEFQSRSSLLLHKSIKHAEKALQCSKCPKRFAFPSHLKNHFNNAHSEAEPQFKCEECGFCAKTMNYLKAHFNRMHKRTQKMYSCEICQKEFRSRARVIEHMRIHTGERPFSCPVCSKTFYSQSNLYAHERTVHRRLTNYGTNDTGQSGSKGLIRRTISSCYQCHMCQISCQTHKKLKYHLMKDHDIEEEAIQEQKIDDVITADVGIGIVHEDEPGVTIKEGGIVRAIEENPDGRSGVSLPAYVVPPNVNLVEIDGIQYHVVRGTQ